MALDPDILKPHGVSAYVPKRVDGQGFNYGKRGPIVGLVLHERQGRAPYPKNRQFFSCVTATSCKDYGICSDGERCQDALVDGEITRDGTFYEYQDAYNTNRIPWASGGVPNNSNPIGAAINAKYRNTFGGVNAVFMGVEFEKTDDEPLTAEQIQTGGKLMAWVMAKAGYPANDWEYPDVLGGNIYTAPHHGDISQTTCRLSDADKAAIKRVCQKELDAFYAGTTPAPSVTYAEAHPVTKGSRVINDHIFLAPGGKTVQIETYPFEWGDAAALPTGPKIKKGTKIAQEQISHYVQGTDNNLWVVVTGLPGVKDGSRIPTSALIADAA